MNFNKNSELTIPEKVKLILNEIIYVELGLQKIEEIFVNAEINNKTIINTENYKLCSKYFFLLNDVYLERLNESEQSLLKYYLDNLNSDNLNVKQELYNFLSERKIKLLLPETN
ncbi:MAG: hypothetical protein PHC56_12080, partial [Herbinix sp.]|nr:hypothetical protein [Herbinix sp.]